ncbi:hypothetical protein HAX54_024588 [Datura stramonium]|uniref:Uncharacterized protein n=1 Tax=Datura stramonium TaxID=4076 RepID=A0ABS8UYL0_DATST|nr:hypothetical protein [Datura stramonium]
MIPGKGRPYIGASYDVPSLVEKLLHQLEQANYCINVCDTTNKFAPIKIKEARDALQVQAETFSTLDSNNSICWVLLSLCLLVISSMLPST